MGSEFIVPEYIFPISTSKSGDPKAQKIKAVIGTAFKVHKDIFLTAGHVLSEIPPDEKPILGIGENNSFEFYPVKEFKVFEKFDFGVIIADLPNSKAFNLSFANLATFSKVYAAGYPHRQLFGGEVEEFCIRGYTGSVVMAGHYSQLAARPFYYELSFPIPQVFLGVKWLYVLQGYSNLSRG